MDSQVEGDLGKVVGGDLGDSSITGRLRQDGRIGRRQEQAGENRKQNQPQDDSVFMELIQFHPLQI